MDESYQLTLDAPPIEDYLRLRQLAGLTPRSRQAAEAGLPNTVIGTVVRHAGEVVGMGRVIGDGLFYLVVDIAVLPAHQRRGIGKAIVDRLVEEIKHRAPAEAHITLIADAGAEHLYSQFGFTLSAPKPNGMTQWIGRTPPKTP